jgi:hypothetical protein
MKYSETIASNCTYGDVAAKILGDAEIIWEDSEDDYSGFANLLARMPDGRFVHLEWDYGSCSGCDDYEARNLSDDDIEAEMRSSAGWLPDLASVRRYLHLDCEGGPMGASESDTFQSMREAFDRWDREREDFPRMKEPGDG